MVLLALSQIYTRVFHFWKSFDLDSPQSRQDLATRIVILTNCGSISGILGDISESQGLQTYSRRLWSLENWTEKKIFNAWLWAV